MPNKGAPPPPMVWGQPPLPKSTQNRHNFLNNWPIFNPKPPLESLRRQLLLQDIRFNLAIAPCAFTRHITVVIWLTKGREYGKWETNWWLINRSVWDKSINNHSTKGLVLHIPHPPNSNLTTYLFGRSLCVRHMTKCRVLRYNKFTVGDFPEFLKIWLTVLFVFPLWTIWIFITAPSSGDTPEIKSPLMQS